MPYNLNIPGQVTQYQLEAIETIAHLLPPGGQMVEVGSLFGASSWCWAKSVDPTVKVFCIDPWVGNKGVKNIEDRHGIKYGLEQFRIFTADCPNIVPKQGFSPRDFLDWAEGPIDLYYEDAVHVDPVLSQNLDFWSSHLKPDGIICGDDFRNRFPDVQNGAERLAKKFNRELITVENFWCLLPNAPPDSSIGKVREKLLALSETYIENSIRAGQHAAMSLTCEDRDPTGAIPIVINISQSGVLAWPDRPSDAPLQIGLSLWTDRTCRESLGNYRIETGTIRQLVCDIPHRFVVNVEPPVFARTLFVVVTVHSSDDKVYEVGRRIMNF